MELKHFKIDSRRDKLVVDVQFYQMDLQSVVNLARQNDPKLFKDGDDFLPSWTKFAANPIKAKGFFSRMLESVFLGQHGLDEVNIDIQSGKKEKGVRVVMMFLPGNMTKDNLLIAEDLAKESLPAFRVKALSGANNMKNKTVEREANDIIDQAERNSQSVLFLATCMAQRSFSVKEITELYLAYDAGDNGATIQKMSRALTPYNTDKIGRIVSLSFDPNRDDKFDEMMIETALHYKKNHNKRSMKEAMRDVLRTIDMFRCTPDGAVKVGIDEYLKLATERKSISRTIGRVSDVSMLSSDMIAALASGKIDIIKNATVESADKGRTRDIQEEKTGSGKEKMVTDKTLVKAREMLVTIAEHLDVIVLGTESSTVHKAISEMKKFDDENRLFVEQEFGVPVDTICYLLECGAVNKDLLELMYDEIKE